jgi:serine/threonine-protein kinase
MSESAASVSDDPVVERAYARVGGMLKDKWRLDSVLGVGGMAAVFAATHRNGARVAVKLLHLELSGDPEVRGRFSREGYVANKVEHPGAVRVLDDDIAEDGSVFLVMELVEGETLAHRWERSDRQLSLSEVLAITDQVLDVLAAAHAKGVVHRDVKPDNVFVSREGTIKLLDFGVARLRELSNATHATRSGHTMGTPAYMSPEQARGRWDELDARSDVWAVGATMFKLLTGRVVHQADTINEQLLAAMTQPAPPIAMFLPNLPIPVVEVIDKALAFERGSRWADARAMQKAVRDAHESVLGTKVPATIPNAGLGGGGAIGDADTVSATRNGATLPAVARESSKWLRRAGRRPRYLGTMVVLAAGVGALTGMGLWMVRSGQSIMPVVSDLMLGAGADGGVISGITEGAGKLIPALLPDEHDPSPAAAENPSADDEPSSDTAETAHAAAEAPSRGASGHAGANGAAGGSRAGSKTESSASSAASRTHPKPASAPAHTPKKRSKHHH